MQLKKSKVLGKGVEAAAVVGVVMAIIKVLGIEMDEKTVTALVIGGSGAYHAIKNWLKHR